MTLPRYLTKVRQMDDHELSAVRRFNRTLTQRLGVLNESYLGQGRPLAEARLLFEIGPEGATVRDLRAHLGLDSGYFSRLLRKLEEQSLCYTEPDASDARVRRIVLSAQGQQAWQVLDQRSKDMAASLLFPLGQKQRASLLQAMAQVERLLLASAIHIELADPFSPDALSCIHAYFQELQQRFEEGFDPGQTVSAEPQELLPPHGYLLLARLNGKPVACAALNIKAQAFGEIKRMWVAPQCRGMGLAIRLLHALEQQARQAGVRVLQLDTHRSLTQARAMYQAQGYEQIPAYNDNPYAHYWFEKRLDV